MKSCNPNSNGGTRYCPPAKRVVLLLCAALSLGTLAGCSSSNGSADTKSLMTIFRLVFAPPQRVTIKQAAGIPYATIGIRLGNSAQAIATLATDNGAQRLWASGQKVMIATTHSGQIQRTVGLPYNLTWTVPAGPDGTAPSAKRTAWSADFADMGIYAATIQCDVVAAANVQISVLGNRITTRRTNLRCTAPQLNWSFQNAYWTDLQTGTVWRSVQHVHPKLDPIEIETLRPPA